MAVMARAARCGGGGCFTGGKEEEETKVSPQSEESLFQATLKSPLSEVLKPIGHRGPALLCYKVGHFREGKVWLYPYDHDSWMDIDVMWADDSATDSD